MIRALDEENADLKKNLSLAGSAQNEQKVRAIRADEWCWLPSTCPVLCCMMIPLHTDRPFYQSHEASNAYTCTCICTCVINVCSDTFFVTQTLK